MIIKYNKSDVGYYWGYRQKCEQRKFNKNNRLYDKFDGGFYIEARQ